MPDRNEMETGRGTEMTDGRTAPARSGTSNRGFASMDRSRQREIASKGGRAAHQKGTAHEWTADEARVAGRKGGEPRPGAHGGDWPRGWWCAERERTPESDVAAERVGGGRSEPDCPRDAR